MKILVIYYSQSGQLEKIARNVALPLSNDKDNTVDFFCLQSLPEYPFPWRNQFFDCFPESVLDIPCKLSPLNSILSESYELIILGYQPWFLSPSIPVASFLKTREAESLLKGNKVITLIGARNMWAGAQEIIKKKLHDIGAIHVGNIALSDKTDNYISAITIIRWLVYGKKKAAFLLPEAGVSGKDIDQATVFGNAIVSCIKENNWKNLQQDLIRANAVPVKYHILNIEINARKIFQIFAKFVMKRESADNSPRKGRIAIFKYYLLFMLFVISPFASLFFMIKKGLFYRAVKRTVSYYQNVNIINAT